MVCCRHCLCLLVMLYSTSMFGGALWIWRGVVCCCEVNVLVGVRLGVCHRVSLVVILSRQLGSGWDDSALDHLYFKRDFHRLNTLRLYLFCVEQCVRSA